tara:strand:- start:823 stop:975 length:153 start_codon:yes stop_codon:yes gene_type:complete
MVVRVRNYGKSKSIVDFDVAMVVFFLICYDDDIDVVEYQSESNGKVSVLL